MKYLPEDRTVYKPSAIKSKRSFEDPSSDFPTNIPKIEVIEKAKYASISIFVGK